MKKKIQKNLKLTAQGLPKIQSTQIGLTRTLRVNLINAIFHNKGMLCFG